MVEVNILAKKASTLRDGERVKIEFNSKNFLSKLYYMHQYRLEEPDSKGEVFTP